MDTAATYYYNHTTSYISTVYIAKPVYITEAECDKLLQIIASDAEKDKQKKRFDCLDNILNTYIEKISKSTKQFLFIRRFTRINRMKYNESF